mgnify:CR=1
MNPFYVRGSTLVVLSYVCLIVFLLSVIIEWLQGNEFDTFYLTAVYMGIILWLLGKWKIKREKKQRSK